MSFGAEFETALQADVMALTNFQTAIASGMSYEEAFSSTMTTASADAQAYAQSMYNAGASLSDFATKQKLAQVSLTAQNKSLVNCKSLIAEYNSGCANVGASQTQFISAIQQSNAGLAKYLTGLNGAQGSLGGYIASLVGAKAASIALQAATMALNMAITMGLSLALQGLVSIITHWVNAEKEARQATIDAGRAAIDSGNNIYDAVAKYLELSAAMDDGTGSADAFAEAQNTVLAALGLAGTGIDELIAKYGDLKTAILEVAKEQFDTNLSLALAGAKAGQKSAVDELVTFFGNNSLVSSAGQNDVAAFRALAQAGFIPSSSFGTQGGSIMLPHSATWDAFSTPSFEDMVENYRYLENVMNFLSHNYSGTDLFSQVANMYKTYDAALKPVIQDIDNANQLIANSLLIDAKTDNNVKDLESYIAMREQLISQLENDQNFNANGSMSASGIMDTLLSQSSAFREYALEYQNYLESMQAAAERTEEVALSSAEKANIIRQKARESFVDAQSSIGKELSQLSEGGSVDLTVRPVIDVSELEKAGWEDVGEGIATVFTSTFSNEAGNIAMNFTPIITDEHGNYVGALSPDELAIYAEGVINGVRPDDLNLKIGSTFVGDNAIEAAAAEAEHIHELQGQFYDEYGQFEEWFSGLNETERDILYNIVINSDGAELKLANWQKTLDDSTFSFAELMAEEDTDGQKSFATRVDNYIKQVTTLKEALADLNSGSLGDSDIYKLMKDFPELAGNSDNLSAAITGLIQSLTGGEDELGNFSGIYADFMEAFNRLESDEEKAKLQDFMNTVLSMGQLIGDTDFTIDIEAETDGVNKLMTALKESVSATGLASDSIANLQARYKDLDTSNLFEKTANGIHLNTKALGELETAYINQQKSGINTTLQNLVDEYNRLTLEINRTSDATQKAELYAKRTGIQQQINDVAMLAAQYEGLTSAFNQWIQAQSMGEEGDMYDSLAGSLKDIKQLFADGLIGTNKFRAAVQLMSNEDLSNASIDELLAAYDTGYSKMTRYFTDSSKGCQNFLEDVQRLNSDWAHMNADGSWTIDFGVGGDKDVADALGISVDAVQAVLRKLKDYGFDINLDSEYTSLDLLKSSAEKANQALIDMGKTDVEFNFDVNSLTELDNQIEQAQTLLDTFKNSDGSVNLELEGAAEAQEILVTLLTQKQLLNAPAVMSVDTSGASADIASCISLMQDFVTNYNDIEVETAVGVDTTTAQTNIQGIASQLSALDDETKIALGLNSSEFDAALASILATEVNVEAGVNIDSTALDTVLSTISGITPEVLVNFGVNTAEPDAYEPDDKNSTVVYTVDDAAVKSYNAPQKTGKVVYTASMNSWTAPTKYGTVIYTAKMSGTAGANGTAYAHGTIGNAFKNGNWGTKGSGDALGGELGQELVVRDGHFFTIGDNGAEFFHYKKGDIIFNAEQTQQILEKGKITHGNGRGKALANGTVSGKAFSSGGGSFGGGGGSGSGSGSGGGGSSSSSDKDFKEVFDWIAVAIDRIERAIDKLNTKASSTYRSWSERNKNLKSEMSKITDEIQLQQSAYNRYMQQANSVGLSSEWMEKIKNGLVDINTITNKDLAEKIKEAQEWYIKICPSIW